MSQIGTRVQRVVIAIVAAAVFVLVGVMMGPTITSSMSLINATSMSGVIMGNVIVTLAQYVGFFYYLGLVLGAMGMVWAIVR